MTAGRVGKPHGLDGSFYVEAPRHALPEGTALAVAGATHAIARRAGTDERPLMRLAGIEDPRPLRGELMLVEDELGRGRVARVAIWSAAPFPASARVAKVIDAPSCSRPRARATER